MVATMASNSSSVASPQGHSASVRSRTSAPWRMSARVRSGWAAAKSIARGPPSDSPMMAARSLPAASMTARMSSMRVSSVVAPGTRSDMPMPRLSKRMSRRERSDALAEGAEQRQLPVHLEVRIGAFHVDDVDGAVAVDGPGDGDIAALGKVDIGHRRSLAAHAARVKRGSARSVRRRRVSSAARRAAQSPVSSSITARATASRRSGTDAATDAVGSSPMATASMPTPTNRPTTGSSRSSWAMATTWSSGS